MKTITTITNRFNKIAVLGALTIAPALALTSTAQAAPRNAVPVYVHQDNDHRQNDNQYNRYNFRPVPVADNHNRFDGNDNRFDNNRFDDHRFDGNRYDNDHRFDRDDHRVDFNRDRDHRDNNTGNLLGAGLIGAVIGAVLSH